MKKWKHKQKRKRKAAFSKEQIEFLNNYGIDPHDLDAVFDFAEQQLRKKGFDIDYNPTEIGLICESILDTLVDMGY